MAEIDYPLLVSVILNIVFGIVIPIVAKKAVDVTKIAEGTSKKLNRVVVLVSDFVTAYQDRTITKEEAQKLINDFKKVLEDP